jgi:hypothetical protein
MIYPVRAFCMEFRIQAANMSFAAYHAFQMQMKIRALVSHEYSKASG